MQRSSPCQPLVPEDGCGNHLSIRKVSRIDLPYILFKGTISQWYLLSPALPRKGRAWQKRRKTASEVPHRPPNGERSLRKVLKKQNLGIWEAFSKLFPPDLRHGTGPWWNPDLTILRALQGWKIKSLFLSLELKPQEVYKQMWMTCFHVSIQVLICWAMSLKRQSDSVCFCGQMQP